MTKFKSFKTNFVKQWKLQTERVLVNKTQKSPDGESSTNAIARIQVSVQKKFSKQTKETPAHSGKEEIKIVRAQAHVQKSNWEEAEKHRDWIAEKLLCSRKSTNALSRVHAQIAERALSPRKEYEFSVASTCTDCEESALSTKRIRHSRSLLLNSSQDTDVRDAISANKSQNFLETTGQNKYQHTLSSEYTYMIVHQHIHNIHTGPLFRTYIHRSAPTYTQHTYRHSLQNACPNFESLWLNLVQAVEITEYKCVFRKTLFVRIVRWCASTGKIRRVSLGFSLLWSHWTCRTQRHAQWTLSSRGFRTSVSFRQYHKAHSSLSLAGKPSKLPSQNASTYFQWPKRQILLNEYHLDFQPTLVFPFYKTNVDLLIWNVNFFSIGGWRTSFCLIWATVLLSETG